MGVPHLRIGRFTQTDPLVENRPFKHYAYASNNPISRIDPMGLDDTLPSDLNSLLDANSKRYSGGAANWRAASPAEIANAYHHLYERRDAAHLQGKLIIRKDADVTEAFIAASRVANLADEASDRSWMEYFRQAQGADNDARVFAQWGRLTPGQRVAKYLGNPNDPTIRRYWEDDDEARAHFVDTVESGLKAAGWFNVTWFTSAMPFGPAMAEAGTATRLTQAAARKYAEQFRALAWDPAPKAYNWREAVQAARFQRSTGITLARGAHLGDDFVAGQTKYSFTGGFSSQHFQAQAFQAAIRRKLQDQTVRVVVDVGTFSRQQSGLVESFIKTLSEADRARIYILR